MSFHKAVMALLVLAVGVTALYGQFAQTNLFTGVNLSIPDGNVNGVQDLRNVVSDLAQITSVRVRLKVTGQFNGDLYGYVRHSSGTTTRISVLLNRPGRATTNIFGYADRGLDVTFDDSATNDIHTYRNVTNPPAGAPLYGTWQPDARFVDPAFVTTTSPRTVFLNQFEGLNADGQWTLFLADVDGGATNFLNSWGLDITGKARPTITWTNPADIIYGTALGANQLNATAEVPGTFTYNPLEGTVLPVGSNQTLSVTFVPADTNSYVEATASVTLTVTPVVALRGMVRYYPTNYPPSNPSVKTVGDVTINLTGDTNLSTLTLGDGSYSLTNVPGVGTYCVTPVKTNDSPTRNGVTSLDLALIQRHILKLTPLDSPYKLLAADANGSGNITSLDLALIQRLILKLDSTLPAGLWRFVPADYVFTNANIPWSAPTNRWYTNLVMDVSGQDFVAIKLGDVNDSWTVPVGGASLAQKSTVAKGSAAASLAPAVVFQVDSLVAGLGERVTARVRVSGFQQVTSAQFTLGWDPAVLRYGSVGDYGLRGLAAGNLGTTLVDGGKLTLAWYDPQGLGVTVVDGTTMFSVNFEVLGQAGSVSALTLSDSPTLREASVNLVGATFGTQGGEIRVVEPGGLRVSGAVYREGVFQLSVPTIPGRSYVLEFTEGLPTTNWTALPAVKGDGTIMSLADPAATNHQRFYRVRTN